MTISLHGEATPSIQARQQPFYDRTVGTGDQWRVQGRIRKKGGRAGVLAGRSSTGTWSGKTPAAALGGRQQLELPRHSYHSSATSLLHLTSEPASASLQEQQISWQHPADRPRLTLSRLPVTITFVCRGSTVISLSPLRTGAETTLAGTTTAAKKTMKRRTDTIRGV